MHGVHARVRGAIDGRWSAGNITVMGAALHASPRRASGAQRCFSMQAFARLVSLSMVRRCKRDGTTVPCE